MNSGTTRTRPLARAPLTIAGSAPGSIIAAVIDTHSATKDAREPSRVVTPMSVIPFISRTETSQHAPASPSVAAAAAAVSGVRALVRRA